jgi:hypothetical protein
MTATQNPNSKGRKAQPRTIGGQHAHGEWARARKPEEATPARQAKPNADRPLVTNPAAGPAVTFGKCPSCGARKGQHCLSRKGEPTNVVHSPRIRAWEAKGSPALPLPTPAVKRAGVWVVVK